MEEIVEKGKCATEENEENQKLYKIKIQKCIGILKNYLARTHSEYLEKEFSEEDVRVLAEFCIIRKKTANELLKPLGSAHDKYFGKSKDDRTHVGIVKDEIQYIYSRFDKKKKEDLNAFDGEFYEFLDWWVSEMDDNGKHSCCYCGVDEDTVKDVFDSKLISSDKRSFSRELQIERLKPKGGYNRENCKFACAVCNNAKSDMISAEDFSKYWADGIKNYWEEIKNRLPKDE